VAKLEITALDISDAEKYLESILQEKYPDYDFSPGSPLRDLLIGPFSYVYALMRKQMESLRSLQSLLTLENQDTLDASEAIDRILSNWMLSRGSGNYARGVVTVQLLDKVDVWIPKSTTFTKSGSLTFVPDTDEEIVAISSDELDQIVNANGETVGYIFRLPVVATQTGTNYNIESGRFQKWTNFSPYVSSVYNEFAFTGGKDIETNSELIARARTALSIRDLNSIRSIDAVLRDQFSYISDVVVKGFGDFELRRDYHPELRLHMGGYADVYINTPLLYNTMVKRIVGEAVEDPRPGYYVLQDAKVDDFLTEFQNWPSDVRQAMIKIYNSGQNEPDKYHIAEVVSSGIRVPRTELFPRKLPEISRTITNCTVNSNVISSTQYSFKDTDVGYYIYFDLTSPNRGIYQISAVTNGSATLDGTLQDETGVTVQLCTKVVDYSVGADSNLSNVISRRKTGLFTKNYSASNRVVLPFYPIGYIKDIKVSDLTFNQRVNTTPQDNSSQYLVHVVNPEEFNTGWQICEIVFPSNYDFDGQEATITFDTIQGYTEVFNYMLDSFRRICCANIIPKGFYFVYLQFTLYYTLKAKGDAFDHTEATNKLIEFINTFPKSEILDVSDISSYIRGEYPQIDYLEPITLTYNLYAPDGRVIPYATKDRVTIDPNYQTGVPDYDRLPDPKSYGITDDVIRYVTNNNLVSLVRLT